MKFNANFIKATKVQTGGTIKPAPGKPEPKNIFPASEAKIASMSETKKDLSGKTFKKKPVLKNRSGAKVGDCGCGGKPKMQTGGLVTPMQAAQARGSVAGTTANLIAQKKMRDRLRTARPVPMPRPAMNTGYGKPVAMPRPDMSGYGTPVPMPRPNINPTQLNPIQQASQAAKLKAEFARQANAPKPNPSIY